MINPIRPAVTPDEQNSAAWRKSSFSNDQGQCVEIATLTDGMIAVRNSNHPEAGALAFSRREIAAWVEGCKSGEFETI